MKLHARHRLATRKQLGGEPLEDFLRALKALSAECSFKAVSASQYQEEVVRDAFVSGLQSQTTRQRLLESKACDLASLLDIARVLHSAQKSVETYLLPMRADTTVASTGAGDRRELDNANALEEPCAALAMKKTRCFFCGLSKHERTLCPARDAVCRRCSKKGHFAKVCRSAPAVQSSACPPDQPGSAACLAVSHAKRTMPGSPTAPISCANFPSSLSKAVISVSLNGREVSCLIDSGSSESFVHPRVVKALGLNTCRSRMPVRMASASSTVTALGRTTATLLVKGRIYENVRLLVLPNLCVDVILGQDFQGLHESLTLTYGGDLPPLTICALAVLKPLDRVVSHGKTWPCSRTTAYNPQGNGQAERYVGVIWKTVTLALRQRCMPTSQWRAVLPDALYALRSLLCTATNATPHERMFSFSRRSTMGTSLPTWLSHPGPALLKKHVRSSKMDPLVEEVELLEANPQYACVRLPDGRESTVSLRHLAPAGSPRVEVDLHCNDPIDQESPSEVTTEGDVQSPGRSTAEDRIQSQSEPALEPQPVALRRSTRIRRPPDRLDL
ncbi:hypothetical protein M513_09048 [Trichuris suis]|uniref:CCHC-type domain-containing protein n=1 Tax=Trichuris suis TaxID=68888 RepID=A0A085LYP2_9BILA|nr:hypothetical protein M513_09048 [Trichuris suis]